MVKMYQGYFMHFPGARLGCHNSFAWRDLLMKLE